MLAAENWSGSGVLLAGWLSLHTAAPAEGLLVLVACIIVVATNHEQQMLLSAPSPVLRLFLLLLRAPACPTRCADSNASFRVQVTPCESPGYKAW
jgi:hypothetical protein